MSVSYQQNFDALTIGTTPASWTNKTGAVATVQAAVPYSGANSMGASSADGDYALLTGITLAANQAVQYVQKLVGTLHCFISPIVRDDGTGANHYLLLPDFVTPNVTLFKKVATNYVEISAQAIPNNSFSGRNAQLGDYMVCKADVNGSTITFKLWLAGTDESNALVLTWTDTTYASGATCGVRQGGTPGTASGVDNFYAGTAGTTFTKIIPVNDANIAYPDSVYLNGSTYAQMSAPGSMLKAWFTATTTIGINVDTSPLSGGGVSAGNYPTIRYSVDDGPAVDVQLASATQQIQASGLSNAAHKLELWLLRSLQSIDRWTTPVNVLRVSSLMVDGGVSTSAPTLAANRLVVIGDSITEGIFDLTNSNPSGNDSQQNFPRMLGAALNAEVTQLGYGGLGITVSGSGNVPIAINSYKLHCAGQARTYRATQYVVVELGTNDTVLTQGNVTALLSDIRTTFGSSTWIWMWVPINGANRSTITAAVASLNLTDSRINILDNGAVGQLGFSASPSLESPEGTHPYVSNHGLQAAMVAFQMQTSTQLGVIYTRVTAALTAAGNLTGKVIGGGSTPFTGDGVQASNVSGNVNGKVLGTGLGVLVDQGVIANIADSIPLQTASIAAALAGKTLIVQSPVGSGSLRIVAEDAYAAADGRALLWTKPAGANWPSDLTSWTITFTATRTPQSVGTGTTTITANGTVITPTGDSQAVQVELTKTNTTGLAIGSGTQGYVFDVVATNGTDRATLIQGLMSVVANVTP